MRPKIKICGITRLEDALIAEDLGADYIGMIFTSKSRRTVDRDTAFQISSELKKAKTIGVFVEQSRQESISISGETLLSGIQHFDLFDRKPPGLSYFYSVRVKNTLHDSVFESNIPDYFLLDAHSDSGLGGTGKTFDWSIIPLHIMQKTIIAGGINAGNISKVIRLNPYAIDLSSSIESAPGMKDHSKMRSLFKEIDNACNA